MQAAEKVKRSSAQPQLRIDVRFQPQAVAFDPTLFKTKYETKQARVDTSWSPLASPLTCSSSSRRQCHEGRRLAQP
jgi:hypothetical protein